MITHNQLIFAIKKDYPSLEHGTDYWVGHEVDGPKQVSEARIYAWYADDPQPDQKALIDRATALLPEFLESLKIHQAA